MNSNTKFYISIADLDRVEKGCDLGDSAEVRVYMYPHRDMLNELVELRLAPAECIKKEQELCNCDPAILAYTNYHRENCPERFK
jgi:hypothetical protein